jgi:hypothetical protein
MQILVQDAKTSMYFTGNGPLTPAPEDALDFRCSHDALRFVLDRRLTGAQMVVRSCNAELIAVPLPAQMAPDSAWTRA